MFVMSALLSTAIALAQTVAVGEMVRISTNEPAFYPQLTADGTSVLVTAQNYAGLVRVDVATGKNEVLSTEARAGRNAMPAAVAVNDKLQLVYNNEVLTPNGEQHRYLWPQLSPDGKRIAYTVSGRGTYVYDLAGRTTTFVGKVRAARWYDDQWLVAMQDRDNGYEVTESAIVLTNVDGTFSQTITPASVKAMYPTAAAGRVAFNTAEGEVYVMTVNINQ